MRAPAARREREHCDGVPRRRRRAVGRLTQALSPSCCLRLRRALARYAGGCEGETHFFDVSADSAWALAERQARHVVAARATRRDGAPAAAAGGLAGTSNATRNSEADRVAIDQMTRAGVMLECVARLEGGDGVFGSFLAPPGIDANTPNPPDRCRGTARAFGCRRYSSRHFSLPDCIGRGGRRSRGHRTAPRDENGRLSEEKQNDAAAAADVASVADIDAAAAANAARAPFALDATPKVTVRVGSDRATARRVSGSGPHRRDERRRNRRAAAARGDGREYLTGGGALAARAAALLPRARLLVVLRDVRGGAGRRGRRERCGRLSFSRLYAHSLEITTRGGGAARAHP